MSTRQPARGPAETPATSSESNDSTSSDSAATPTEPAQTAVSRTQANTGASVTILGVGALLLTLAGAALFAARRRNA